MLESTLHLIALGRDSVPNVVFVIARDSAPNEDLNFFAVARGCNSALIMFFAHVRDLPLYAFIVISRLVQKVRSSLYY